MSEQEQDPMEAVEAPKRAASRARTSRALPTDRLKFDKQVKALMALAHESRNGQQAVDSAALSKRIGVAEATAGLNNAFFVEAGLAAKAGKGKYKPTPAALAFEREAGFGGEVVAAKKNLAAPLSQAWFFKEIQSQARMGDTSERGIIAVLAKAANASKEHTPKLTSVLEWLRFAGLITLKDGQVALAADAPETPEPNAETENGAGQTPEVPDPAGTGTTTEKKDRGPIVLEVNFSCSYTAKDLAELEPDQIKALYEAVGGIQAVQAVLLSGREKS